MRLALAAAVLCAGVVLAEERPDDQKAFQGMWTIVHHKQAGEKDPVTAPTVVFSGNRYKIQAGEKVVEEGTFQVDGSKSPKQIEVSTTEGVDKGKKWHGIYEVQGDTLRAVVGPTEKDRPTKYDNPPEGVRSFLLKREKKKESEK